VSNLQADETIFMHFRGTIFALIWHSCIYYGI